MTAEEKAWDYALAMATIIRAERELEFGVRSIQLEMLFPIVDSGGKKPCQPNSLGEDKVLDETTEDLADELIDQLELFLANKFDTKSSEQKSNTPALVSRAERFVCLLKQPVLVTEFLDGIADRRLSAFAKEKLDQYTRSVGFESGVTDFRLYVDFTFGLYKSEY